MPHLIWSPEALRDLQRLHRFIVVKNPPAARRAVAAIRSGVRILSDYPLLGRPADGAESGEFREWVIPFASSSYVVLYRYDPDGVVVLAVRHARELGYRSE